MKKDELCELARLDRRSPDSNDDMKMKYEEESADLLFPVQVLSVMQNLEP